MKPWPEKPVSKFQPETRADFIDYPTLANDALNYERACAEAAIERLRAIKDHCEYIRKVSSVARDVLKLIGELPE